MKRAGVLLPSILFGLARFLNPSGPPDAKLRPVDKEEHEAWTRDFEAAARRTLEERLRYAFIRTYKPVLDDEPYRSFDTMAGYRRWCEESLPSWLGYGRSL